MLGVLDSLDSRYVDGSPERKAAAYAALTPGQRAEMAGATAGMLKRAGQAPVNAVFGAAAVVNAGVDVLSGGRLYGGSAEQLADGFVSAGQFLANPIENTRAHFERIDANVLALRDQGRHYEAGEAASQAPADIFAAGATVSGMGALGTTSIRLGARATRDSAIQLAREASGSPTVYYVQEAATDYIINFPGGQRIQRQHSPTNDVELHLASGPHGASRVRGEGGRFVSLPEEVRRQLNRHSDRSNLTISQPSTHRQRRMEEVANRMHERRTLLEDLKDPVRFLKGMAESIWKGVSDEIDG